uniref:Leptin receptor gene-related protein n=1 Tax=Aceria tosichella TaxID=561515 RepID=A0A6G1SHC4_9ACAR
MPGQRPILAMSFVASLGITFQLLACTVPKGEGNLWPMLVYIFYILLPIPILVSTHIIKETMVGMNEKDAAKAKHYAIFFTAGILVSSFAMPILLARSPEANPIIKPIQCVLVEIGNVLCYATMGLFCIYFKPLSN